MGRYSEMEFKWSADNVTAKAFRRWCNRLHPERYDKGSFPDVFYVQGENVVRHRWDKGPGQLTVKQRRSLDSMVDRVEVDLDLAPHMTHLDVTKFLTVSGWKRQMTLFKNFVETFWIEDPLEKVVVIVALYEVEKLDERTHKRVGTRRFMEVECDKDSALSNEQARTVLDRWKEKLTTKFDLGKPLNRSLYEIYSGHKTIVTKLKERKC